MKTPCQNGATCSPIYSRDEYKCMCLPGFTGKHCETGKYGSNTMAASCMVVARWTSCNIETEESLWPGVPSPIFVAFPID